MAIPVVPFIKYLYTLLKKARGQAGAIETFAGDTPPPDFLECNGQALISTDYPNLFEIIGTSYGDGSTGIGASGSTDFNVPDLRGQFVRGYDNGAGNDPDAASRVVSPSDATVVGDVVGSYQEHDFVSHAHFQAGAPARGGGGTGTGHEFGGVLSDNSSGVGTFGSELRPVNISLIYIIKT